MILIKNLSFRSSADPIRSAIFKKRQTNGIRKNPENCMRICTRAICIESGNDDEDIIMETQELKDNIEDEEI